VASSVGGRRARGRAVAFSRRRHTFLLVTAVGLAIGLASCGGGSSAAPAPTFQTLIAAGNSLLKAGNAGAAEQLYQQAIRRDPKEALGYYDLGASYQQEGETAGASVEYSKALRQNPAFVPALYNEAVIASSADPTQAMAIYRRVISIQPDSPTALLNLGLLQTRDPETRSLGIQNLKKAVRLEPSLRDNLSEPLLAQVG
jgi:tetratricopeptide (TPR) repeat protein